MCVDRHTHSVGRQPPERDPQQTLTVWPPRHHWRKRPYLHHRGPHRNEGTIGKAQTDEVTRGHCRKTPATRANQHKEGAVQKSPATSSMYTVCTEGYPSCSTWCSLVVDHQTPRVPFKVWSEPRAPLLPGAVLRRHRLQATAHHQPPRQASSRQSFSNLLAKYQVSL